MHGMMFRGELAESVFAGRKTETRRPHDPYRDCPFAAWLPGMAFYAKERFRLKAQFNTQSPNDAIESSRRRGLGLPDVWCDASGTAPSDQRWGRCRPSIHMPAVLSRSKLVVTNDVCAEPLMDIDDDGARAEGFTDRAAFLKAFAAIYGARAGANPCVTVIRFRRIGRCVSGVSDG